jgi:benzoyl-CoA reductase subunit A
MKCYVGIDLGSTTSKAVVLDDGGHILGRGITNSRSNYDMASAVARTEAYVTTRFTLFERDLEQRLSDAPKRELQKLSGALQRSFRLQQYLTQLAQLERLTEDLLDSRRYASRRGDVRPRLRDIFGTLHEEAPTLFAEGAKRKSDFFRDIAGASYQHAAERFADPVKAPFGLLLALYDKAIIDVENEQLELGFQANIGPALERALGRASDDTRVQCAEAAQVAAETEFEEVRVVGTGYGRARLPFPRDQIRSEILCHGLGAHAMFPETRTVLDIGGQDTKAIQVDEAGIVTSFQMNDRCAAGCGRYLGYIADEMNLGLHELGPLAQQAQRKVRISSTCTVFAGAELRERLALGEKREDILGGLHRAIILRAMSLLARSGGVDDEFTFTGGVANNQAAVDALRDLVAENYGDRTLNISPDSIYTGALGAALFALRDMQRADSPMEVAA